MATQPHQTDDFAIFHRENVARSPGYGKVVGNDNERHALADIQFVNRLHQIMTCSTIQVSCWFIHKDQRRFA